MPFFAHFGLVIFVNVWSIIELIITMSISTIVIEFTRVVFHPVFAKFSLIIKSKVFNILYHFFSGFKVHLFFRSAISLWAEIVIYVLLSLNFLNLLHQLVVRMLSREERLESVSCRIHSEFIQLSYARKIRSGHVRLLLNLYVMELKWFESLFYKLKSKRFFALELMEVIMVVMMAFVLVLILAAKYWLNLLFNIWPSLSQLCSFFLWNNHTIIFIFVSCFHVLKSIPNAINFVNRTHSLSLLLLIITFLW